MFGLATYEMDTPFGSVKRLAAVIGNHRVVDLRSAYRAHLALVEKDPHAAQIAAVRIPDTMMAFIQGGEPSLAAAKAAVEFAENHGHDGRASIGRETVQLSFALESVRLCIPLMPGKIVALGRNYADHQKESVLPPPDDFPRGFVKVNSSLIGPDADISYPKVTTKLDYEVELAVIIGKGGRDIPAEKADEHIFGYTIFNDMGGRDWQFEERKKGNHLLGKNFDGMGPMGPYIVPKEFVRDPMNLRLVLRVNGGTRQESNTRHMIYDIGKLIAHWSKMTLESGDMISTGTPSGVASGRKPEDPSWYLKPGDVVEAEIEGLGILRNRVVEKAQ